MKCSVRLDRFLLCPMSRIKAWYGIIDLYQEEDMKMRTKKWSTLLAAVIAMTELSSITLAADYTTGLTGAYRADHKLVKAIIVIAFLIILQPFGFVPYTLYKLLHPYLE